MPAKRELSMRHMWNGRPGKLFFQTFHPAGTMRSYVRPVSAALDRWPRCSSRSEWQIKYTRCERIVALGLSRLGNSPRGVIV